MGWGNNVNVNVLEGQVIKEIRKVDNEELYFYMEDGKTYRMYHDQDCCESVYIEDIIGDLDDLIGTPIGMAEEVTEDGSGKDKDGWYDSVTWTFYKFATLKGYVTIRWFGESNGYYSESVDLELVENDTF